ncbi:unnamed protein product [Amoebophrya sp. A120]|nr:unnamed protein product [Amoebophrya sp. A120]|eukprot:GSA120T00006986001.1
MSARMKNRFSLEACKQRSAAAEEKVLKITKQAKEQILKTSVRQNREEWLRNWQEWRKQERELSQELDEFALQEQELLLSTNSAAPPLEELELQDRLVIMPTTEGGRGAGPENNYYAGAAAGVELENEKMSTSTSTTPTNGRSPIAISSSSTTTAASSTIWSDITLLKRNSMNYNTMTDQQVEHNAASSHLSLLLEFCRELQAKNEVGMRLCESQCETITADRENLVKKVRQWVIQQFGFETAGTCCADGMMNSNNNQAGGSLEDLSFDEEEFLNQFDSASRSGNKVNHADDSKNENEAAAEGPLSSQAEQVLSSCCAGVGGDAVDTRTSHTTPAGDPDVEMATSTSSGDHRPAAHLQEQHLQHRERADLVPFLPPDFYKLQRRYLQKTDALQKEYEAEVEKKRSQLNQVELEINLLQEQLVRTTPRPEAVAVGVENHEDARHAMFYLPNNQNCKINAKLPVGSNTAGTTTTSSTAVSSRSRPVSAQHRNNENMTTSTTTPTHAKPVSSRPRANATAWSSCSQQSKINKATLQHQPPLNITTTVDPALQLRRLLEQKKFSKEQISIAYKNYRKKRKQVLLECQKEFRSLETKEEQRFETDFSTLKKQQRIMKQRQQIISKKNQEVSAKLKKNATTFSSTCTTGINGKRPSSDYKNNDSMLKLDFLTDETQALAEQSEKSLHEKLQQKEKLFEIQDRKRQLREEQREAAQRRELDDYVSYLKQDQMNAERKKLRDTKERLKFDEKQRVEQQLLAEKEKAEQNRLRLLDKLKVEAPVDPERLTRNRIAEFKYFDPKSTICRNQVADVHGYFEERLAKDPRYRLSAALSKTNGNSKNLLTSDAARAAMGSLKPELPRNHALASHLPGLSLGG